MPPDGGQWPNEGFPAGSGTPYGQQPQGVPGAFGQQPYGQGGTQPQSGHFGNPHGAGNPSYGPGGEPPKKRHAVRIIGVAIVAVVVVLGVVAGVIGASSRGDKSADASPASPASASPSAAGADVPQHTIKVPKTFGGYRRITGDVADRLTQTMRKSMDKEGNGKYAGLYAKAKIAIYAKKSDATQTLVFIGLASSDGPAVARELKSTSPSDEADAAFVGMGIGQTKDFPAGPLGGVLRCGAGSMEGSGMAACTWADSSTAGLVLVPESRNATALAGSTLKLRNAAEH